ncbi:MAG: hypothetical protein AAF742_03780, partial [Pseudomonadota bacterium]
MRWVVRILGGLLGLVLIAALGAYLFLWWKPIGVNNYINKVAIGFLIESPEAITQLGIIDNTPFDFHSGKLADYTKENEDKQLAELKKARAGLDKYGPEGLDGQELLSWQITAWFLDDIIRQSQFDFTG